MRILIAGAGIGGLSAALGPHDAGFEDLVVAEAAPALRPLGAGLNLLPNAVRELAALGLYREVAAVSVPVRELVYCTHRGAVVWREPRGQAAGHRRPQLSVHRGRLQEVLADAVRRRLGPDAVLTDSRLASFTETAGGRLSVLLEHPAAGTSDTLDADVLVGADGIRSAVRRLLYPEEGSPACDGTVVWRGTPRSEPFLTGCSMVVMGDGLRKVVAYPLPGPGPDGRVLINWAASRAPADGEPVDRTDWNRPVPREKFLSHFAGRRYGDLSIEDLLEGDGPVVEFPLLDRDPLPRWSFGRTTLLGDAAHAMAPMGSNATTRSVVDARAPAYALARHDDPAGALAAYERDRRPAMTRLQLASRAKGPEVVIDLACARPGRFRPRPRRHLPCGAHRGVPALRACRRLPAGDRERPLALRRAAGPADGPAGRWPDHDRMTAGVPASRSRIDTAS
ncbi:FAD-dependent monooxygenase [Streptomyces sp. KL2]|uniref:FAD-dependent monooxygenase n=1 Tax=Streptomyces sp. KL2 TaxID=3050126 RepID=UPI00397D0F9C